MPPPRAESTEEEENLLLEAVRYVGESPVGQFAFGLPRGAITMGEATGIGLASLLPEEQELALRDYLKSGAESARQAITPAFYDPQSFAAQAGEVFGQTIPYIGIGGVGALAARAGARAAGTLAGAGVRTAGAGTAAGAAGAGQQAGIALERARAKGVLEV